MLYYSGLRDWKLLKFKTIRSLTELSLVNADRDLLYHRPFSFMRLRRFIDSIQLLLYNTMSVQRGFFTEHTHLRDPGILRTARTEEPERVPSPWVATGRTRAGTWRPDRRPSVPRLSGCVTKWARAGANPRRPGFSGVCT